jgi:Uma2 family endonuclease
MGPLMSTTTTPRRTGPTIPGETRICIPGVNWRFYEWLVDSIPEGTGVRVAFDGTDVEIMTTSPEHEDFKELLGRFVGLVAEELGVPHKSMGETTWKRVRVNRGIEADQCFYFRPDKLAAAAAAKAKRTNDVAHYPDPDLAIEVDLSPSTLDRPGIYAALKVAEVWRFNGQNLRIDRLSSRGRYAAVAASKLLPVRADQICRWILEEDTSDLTSWSRSVRQWVRADLSRVD